jgi:hypothetical protein
MTVVVHGCLQFFAGGIVMTGSQEPVLVQVPVIVVITSGGVVVKDNVLGGYVMTVVVQGRTQSTGGVMVMGSQEVVAVQTSVNVMAVLGGVVGTVVTT